MVTGWLDWLGLPRWLFIIGAACFLGYLPVYCTYVWLEWQGRLSIAPPWGGPTAEDAPAPEPKNRWWFYPVLFLTLPFVLFRRRRHRHFVRPQADP